MTVNVLIGVGGTGAKVVEAALHLFLAGEGPDNVIVGLVDQDNSNGNVERTRSLLTRIQTMRADWSPPNGNRLDWTVDQEAGGVQLGRVALETLLPNDSHWRPSADDHGTLAQILDRAGLDDDHRALFDLLFVPGAEEQDMPLSAGYRGRAHVGSAAMLASLELEEGIFKRRIEELMRTPDQPVRIFLVGSVFGGTGAAGFPTLSRAINKIRDAMPRVAQERIKLGGALMLPYFGFDDPANERANVVRATELLPQARVALEFYHRLFEHEPVFDRFYVAGWNSFFQMGYHEPGNRGQRNPPLAPELLGALAALDFFAATLEGRPQRVPVMTSARQESSRLTWRDLPVEDDDARQRLYARLGGLLRFATYWRYVAEPGLDDRNKFFGKTRWISDLTGGVDWGQGTPKARETLAALANDVLVWAETMRLFGDTGGERLEFGLWNTDDLAAAANRREPTRPVTLHDRLATGGPLEAAYDKVLTAADPNAPPRSAAQLYEEVNERRMRAPAAGNTGLGKLVAAVSRAARPF